MTMTDQQLDRLARAVPTAEGKNTIHACRPDHPLGRGNPFKWRNAQAAAASIHVVDRMELSMELRALERCAKHEAETETAA